MTRCRPCDKTYPDDLLFCEECGAALTRSCPGCGGEVTASKKFCGHCGTRLTAPSSPGPQYEAMAPTRTAAIVEEGERRPLCVMFVDLVGSTPLAASMDAEEWREIVTAYHRAVVDAVARYGGFVAQKFGDGALIYFGFPNASDNDPERSVRAGFAILEAVGLLKRDFMARIGIHFGQAVLDRSGEIFGDVANVAARIQAAADPGQILISDALLRLTADLLVTESRGLTSLKGVAEPLELFRVQQISGEGRRRSRQQARISMVGRDEELGLLNKLWKRALAGSGQTVTVIGEPGAGKTRLIDEFRAQCQETSPAEIEWQCVELLAMAPFHPMTQWARQCWGGAEEAAESRIDAFYQELSALGLNVPEFAGKIAPLLDLPITTAQPAALLSPEGSRKQQLEVWLTWFLARVRVRPTILIIEDLHWADPSTLDLLALLSEQTVAVPLLLILTARRQFRPSWRLQPHHHVITLSPLDDSAVREMVANIVTQQALGRDLIDSVVSRAGGVPLFVEEVTRLLLNSPKFLAASEIPPTLQASLMARIDHLGPEKKLAQIGAVLGREFSWRLIRAVTGFGDNALMSALEHLVQAGLIYREGFPPEASYRFKHALIQDAAYGGLLKSQRRELHRAAAEALAQQSDGDAKAELLAHHLTEAGETAQALRAWQAAGDSALERNAFVEAASHYSRCIDILERDEKASAAQNFAIRSKLAECYRASKGFANDLTRNALNQAWQAGSGVADESALIGLLSRLVSAAYHAADFEQSRDYADRLAALSRQSGQPLNLAWAAIQYAVLNFCLGDLAAALSRLDEADALLQTIPERGKAPIDPATISSLFRVYTWVHGGRFAQARQQAAEGLQAAATRGGPYNLAWSHVAASYCAGSVGELAEAAAQARLLIDLAERHGLPQFSGYGHLFLGAAQLAGGEAALAELERGLDHLREVGSTLFSNLFHGWRAEALALAGRLDAAVEQARQAVALVGCAPIHDADAKVILARILRRQGGDSAEADALCHHIIDEAVKAGNLLPALMAATDLAQLRRDRGDQAGAQALLLPLLARFDKDDQSARLRQAITLSG